MRPFHGVALLLLLAGWALLFQGCGPSEESQLLKTYEVQVEPLLKEDEPVGQRIEDLRKEFEAGNSTADDFLPFAKTTGLPFYGNIAEKAQAIKPGFKELEDAHAMLVQYIAMRREYLAVIVRVFEAGTSEPMLRLTKAHVALQEQWQALAAEAQGAKGDMDVARAIGECQAFEARIGLFRRGGVAREVVQAEISDILLPNVRKVSERLRPHREAAGFDGAAARWSAATAEYYEAVVGSLPLIERFMADSVAADEAYTLSGKLRAEFLTVLRSLRERFR
jgi:hypothetical protein